MKSGAAQGVVTLAHPVCSAHRDTRVVAPGGQRGHVVKGLALNLVARRRRLTPRLPRGHPLEPLLERLQRAVLIRAVTAVPAALDRHPAAFTTHESSFPVLTELSTSRRIPSSSASTSPAAIWATASASRSTDSTSCSL